MITLDLKEKGGILKGINRETWMILTKAAGEYGAQ
jgi:hypothetical protein